MADNIFGTEYVKLVFRIPEWYILSEKEECKLRNYLNEASTHRFLDCCAYCDGRFCYFCAAYDGDVPQLCAPCHGLPARE